MEDPFGYYEDHTVNFMRGAELIPALRAVHQHGFGIRAKQLGAKFSFEVHPRRIPAEMKKPTRLSHTIVEEYNQARLDYRNHRDMLREWKYRQRRIAGIAAMLKEL